MSDRSASPVRDEPKPKKQKTGGFKWKDRKPKDEEAAESRDSGRLERGYRDQSPRRDSYRGRDDNRRRDRSPRPSRDDRRTDSYRPSERDRAARESDSYRPKPDTKPSDIPSAESKFGSRSSAPASNDVASKFPGSKTEPATEKKKSKPKTTASNEPMIIVNVNDRLGTKAAIPCLASDSIKAFKAIVAAHIGRQPHEIMLKRQGERPFKDQLTLEDYGVSSGVQLDLELDTGD
jgi:hypothetical protein